MCDATGKRTKCPLILMNGSCFSALQKTFLAVYLGTFQKQKSLSAAVLRTKHKEKETFGTATIHIEGY